MWTAAAALLLQLLPLLLAAHHHPAAHRRSCRSTERPQLLPAPDPESRAPESHLPEARWARSSLTAQPLSTSVWAGPDSGAGAVHLPYHWAESLTHCCRWSFPALCRWFHRVLRGCSAAVGSPGKNMEIRQPEGFAVWTQVGLRQNKGAEDLFCPVIWLFPVEVISEKSLA